MRDTLDKELQSSTDTLRDRIAAAPKPECSEPSLNTPATDALEDLKAMSQMAFGHVIQLLQIQREAWRLSIRRAILMTCVVIGVGITAVATLVSAIVILMQSGAGALSREFGLPTWGGQAIVSVAVIMVILVAAWVASLRTQRATALRIEQAISGDPNAHAN